MLQASSEKITFNFKLPAGTSRGVLKTKNSWIIKIWDDAYPDIVGTGEASIIENLSPDWNEDYEQSLDTFIDKIDQDLESELMDYPSIRFAFESAKLDLKNGGKQHYFENSFTSRKEGIRINGLIWMGAKNFMFEQIQSKIESGFTCLKLKIWRH